MPEDLIDYNSVFQTIIPGSRLEQDTRYGGIVASWYVRMECDFRLAPTPERAKMMATQLAEQMRIRAIRELGLEPILEAQREEVRTFQRANLYLQKLNEDQARDIKGLQEQIRIMLNEDAL